MLVKYKYLLWVFILLCVVAPNSFAGGWEQVTELPKWRVGGAAAAVNGKIYLIGGFNYLGGLAAMLSTVDVYDARTNTWHTVANMPKPRVAVKTAVFSSEIYAFAGYDRQGPRGARRDRKIIEMYNTHTDTWVKKPDMPTLRTSFATAVVDGKIYLIGGRVKDKRGEEVITGLVEVYDPLTDRWDKRTDMPTVRSGMDAVVVEGKIYVIGGQTRKAPGLVERFVRSIEEYNPKTDKWHQLPDMPVFKFWFSTVAVDKEIYTIGGIDNGLKRTDVVDVYNPTTDKWHKIEPITTPKTTTAAVANGTIYTLGGLIGKLSDFRFSPIVEAFDTGFRAVTAYGKLSTSWGELKAENQK